MTDNRQSFQTIWGIALVLAGIGVFYRIPQVMPQIQAAGFFPDAQGFIRFCFYFIGAALLFGGGKKLIGIYRSEKIPSAVDSNEPKDTPPQ
ncbi:MAG: hypothetical protein ABIL58_06080 [Pseudomonadota bacterium]